QKRHRSPHGGSPQAKDRPCTSPEAKSDPSSKGPRALGRTSSLLSTRRCARFIENAAGAPSRLHGRVWLDGLPIRPTVGRTGVVARIVNPSYSLRSPQSVNLALTDH